MDNDAIGKAIAQAIGLLTAHQESDKPDSKAMTAEQYLQQTIAAGPSAQGELLQGLVALSALMLDDLATCQGSTPADLLQGYAKKFVI